MVKHLCDTCGQTDVMIGGGLIIHSMQKTLDGKLIAYKTTQFAQKDSPCNPCKKYVEHVLGDGAIECDYFGNSIK